MIARHCARVIRNTGSQRRGIQQLVDKPSTVAKDQAIFKGSRPTYIKRDSDSRIYLFLLGMVGVGTIQLLRGEINMSSGSGKAGN